MNKSETIGKLGEALAKAQGKMENAKKDSKNPFFKSTYADLASCSEACKKELSENGIAVVQFPYSTENGKIGVETVLVHSSGEWMSERLDLTPVKSDPQSAGSAITYARRYALCAAVGIAPEDDDGNAASGNGSHELPKKEFTPKQAHEDPSPKTLEAKAKSVDPLKNKYLNGKWKDVVIHFGKNKGTRLGDLPATSLRWYRDDWKPKPYNGVIDAATLDLAEALKAYGIERAIEKERSEYVQGEDEETEIHNHIPNNLERDEIPF